MLLGPIEGKQAIMWTGEREREKRSCQSKHLSDLMMMMKTSR